MKYAIVIFLLVASAVADAKDRQFSSQWSGAWSDATGDVQCGISVTDLRRSRITATCQFGPDGASSGTVTVPQFGDPLYFYSSLSDFGSEPSGLFQWGYVRWYAVCNGAPEIIGTVYINGHATDIRLFPLSVAAAPYLCD